MADPTLTIGQLVEQYQADVLARDAEAMARIVEAYRRIYGQLMAQIEALLSEIAASQAAGQVVTSTQIRKLARFQRVIGDVAAELAKFGAILENEVLLAQMAAAQMAASGVPAFVQALLPGQVSGSIMATFGVLPADAIEALVGALQEGSPLITETLAAYGAETAAGIADTLLTGVAQGLGPRQIAAQIQRLFGVPLSDALRIVRTEIMRAFNAATLAAYQANPHIVKNWIWHATLDTRTCMGCIAMHGSVHPLTEELDDHPNGRCCMVPQTVTMQELGINVPETGLEVQPGADWFAEQSADMQLEMLGPGKYDLWLNGQLSVSDLAKIVHDPRWGDMVVETPLKELLGDTAD